MWLVAEYQPVTLFSFRSGLATSSGAKTLFLPTPFAIRTALLDVAIRTEGLAAGHRIFDAIKRLSIAVRPPERVMVTNLFAKILKPTRKDEPDEPMDRSIAFREYAQLGGTLALAFGMAEAWVTELQALLVQVNYFGKRGCFFQLMGVPEELDDLPAGFVPLNGVYLQGDQVQGLTPNQFVAGIIQMMDDWGDTLTFEKANIYSDEKIELGKDRVRKSVILPYRLVRASRSYSYYERIDCESQ